MINEKIQLLKEDFDFIYAKGKGDGYDEGWEEGTSYGEYKKQEWIDKAITNNGTRTHYQGAFARQDWSGYTFTIPVTPVDNAQNLFFTYQGTSLPMGIDCSRLTGPFTTAFRYSHKITYIPDYNIPALTDYPQSFANMNLLQKIEVVRCNENTKFTNTFSSLPALTEIRFEGTICNNLSLSSSTKLTKETLLHIIDHLQDKTNDTSSTWTLSLGTDNLQKLSPEEIEEAEKKGWVLN